MNVRMRDALTHSVVQRHKSSLCSKASFNGESQQPRIRKQLSQQWGFDIDQRIKMLFRNQKTVAGEHRTMIQKGQARIVFKDDRGGNFTRDDLAKDATVHELGGAVADRLQLGSASERLTQWMNISSSAPAAAAAPGQLAIPKTVHTVLSVFSCRYMTED